MSKTYRRTDAKGKHDYNWVLRDWQVLAYPSVHIVHSVHNPHSVEGKRRIARFHSDNGCFMGNAPSWYCNVYQRSIRQEGRRQIHRFIREDAPVILERNHHHSATWSWW